MNTSTWVGINTAPSSLVRVRVTTRIRVSFRVVVSGYVVWCKNRAGSFYLLIVLFRNIIKETVMRMFVY